MSDAAPPSAAMTEPTPTSTVAAGSPAPSERTPIPELVTQALSDASSLVRLEIELAKTELAEQAKQGAAGMALFIVAAVLAGTAWLLLSFAAVYGLARVVPVWAAFLIVAGVYLLLGALLVLIGRSRLQKVRGPERARHQLDLTKQALAPKP